MSLENLLNELPRDASPKEIVQLAWDKYVTTNGPTDLDKWINREQFPFTQTPVDNILPDEVIEDRQKVFTQAVNIYDSLGEMWRISNKDSLLLNMNKVEKHKCKNVFISLYPSYQIDAYAFRSYRGDHIILLHFPINDFLYRLMFPIMQMIMGISRPNLDSLKSELNNIWYGRTTPPKPVPKSETEALTLFYLMKAGTFFILGHEFGHIIKEHNGYTNKKIANHSAEYDADKIGTELLFKAWATGTYLDENFETKTYNESHYIYGLVAPVIIFGGFSLLNNKESITHPSPTNRIQKFINYHNQYFPSENTWSPNDFRQYDNSLSVFQDLFTLYNSNT